MTGGRSSDTLSPREREVLGAVAEHRTNAEIAAELFISVRTVESHVAALLRKTSAGDRRALIAAAPGLLRAGSGSGRSTRSSVTSFVGRVAEREALGAALDEHPLVTALGPGGVGKTRLAQAVMAERGDRYADGAWYVDLVPVTDPERVAPAIAAVLGIPERQDRSLAEGLAAWLAGRDLLLVLDNCEHLLDGVAALLEHLLLASGGLVVLATSRTRLAVPFESVFPVPGLSSDRDGAPGDAVRLFEARAAAAGVVLGPELRPRVAHVCDALDGMALAIELAAARLPAMGLDGLEAGLADRLPMLTGGRRADDRHRSLRATLDWSYALLPAADKAVLRGVAVFAAPFSASAAASVLQDDRSTGAEVEVLAELADSSLVIAELGPRGTRYRLLETIRQYGAERLAEHGEDLATRSAHLAWCAGEAEELRSRTDAGGELWREDFDAVADDLRAALAWARGRPDCRAVAYRLAERFGSALFTRGRPAESQRRLEEAAALAADPATAASCLRAAAGAAEARQAGNESFRLRRDAAAAFVRAGDPAGGAEELTKAALLVIRFNMLSPPPGPEEVRSLLTDARRLAGDDPVAQGRVLASEACLAPQDDATSAELARRAIELTHRAGDAVGESVALDALCAVQLTLGDLQAGAASAFRRVELLDPLVITPELGFELFDALGMSTGCAVGVGDLTLAARFAGRILALPYYAEEQHLATTRLLIVDALAGNLERCALMAERFREDWDRAGRPLASNLSAPALSASVAFALLGDDAAAAEWRAVTDLLLTGPERDEEFDLSSLEVLVLLHRCRFDEAVRRLTRDPLRPDDWYNAAWRPWYAALWAEAAVLADLPDAAERVARARRVGAPNPIAVALLDRAAALLDGDEAALPAIAERLRAAGCPYQAARTGLLAAPGDLREQGAADMARLGATVRK
ncbi:MAG TPA: LuxR C-terminal-related transcriptional regulator [Amnibacterium sp.]|uniref:ATP-binding protein n=1 Tax=Amnibacterium sp. TaxID=1872496 RepID=UPI002F947D80